MNSLTQERLCVPLINSQPLRVSFSIWACEFGHGPMEGIDRVAIRSQFTNR
jgi:hypothetical protein